MCLKLHIKKKKKWKIKARWPFERGNLDEVDVQSSIPFKCTATYLFKDEFFLVVVLSILVPLPLP